MGNFSINSSYMFYFIPVKEASFIGTEASIAVLTQLCITWKLGLLKEIYLS